MNKLNVVVVGAPSAGKTALIGRMLGRGFNLEYQEMIGTDTLPLPGADVELQLELIDYPGAQRYQDQVNLQLQTANVILLCLDVSRADAAENFNAHIELIRKASKSAKVIVIGTKVDDLKAVNTESLAQIMKGANLEPLILTSAKNDIGGDKVIVAMSEIGRSLFSQNSIIKKDTDAALNLLDDDVEMEPDHIGISSHSGKQGGVVPEFSAGFFLQVMAHPATPVIGGLLVIAGLMALGIGIASLCFPLIPVLAGVVIVLAQSVVTPMIATGVTATLLGAGAMFLHQREMDDNAKDVKFSTNGEPRRP